MPLTYSAKRALRKDLRRTEVNRRVKNLMKINVKSLKETKLSDNLPKAFQAIDRSVKKNLIHWKKAARLKSQLAKITSVAPVAEAKTTKAKTTKKVAKAPKTSKKK